MFDLLEDIKEGKLKKKRELIPGEFIFEIRFLDKTTELVNRVTPSLVPVKPCGTDKDKVVPLYDFDDCTPEHCPLTQL